MANPKLKISVNKNPTKEGIKVQFAFPETLGGDSKTEMTQKIQNKLNQGLSQYNLTANIDTDVPYENVIGFIISIQEIKLLIKKALEGNNTVPQELPPAPAPAPAPAAPAPAQ